MTRVKICGITTPGDAKLAVEAGAWAIGLIFAQPSPRRCDVGVASEIGRTMRRQVEVAGVFRNSPLDEVVELADLCSLTMVQLHGDEGPTYCAEAAHRTGLKVIKAARVRDRASVQALRAFRVAVDYHLLDAFVEGVPGGTGQTFRWDLAKERGPGPALILSGGITADNVSEAIAGVHPYAVDSASGTEASPGVKDPAKVTALMRAVEQASLATA
ncbi:MAG: phosphoribosylanthranilate isomerase [Thermoleophilaceae bacterium]|jgi:phosphoribosylanthranilate isomerase|nr:phosphoribosylanthranilate isomerase [Thermoleophilaceae bacterium]